MRIQVRTTKLLLAGIAGLALAQPGLVNAQEAKGAGADSNDDQNGGIGDIVVTAQRRNENIQKTPLAITAFSGETLAKNNVTDLRNLSALAPSLVVSGNNQFGEFPLAIRGIGSSSSGIGADDPVSIYVDGVYIGRPSGAVFEFADVKRIEVLRGPQGTLYGRNATGGAINILTEEPGDQFNGSIRASYGSFNTVHANAFVSAPLGEGISSKLAATYSRTDGFETNLFDGSHINKTENFGIRGAFRIQPADALTLTLAGDFAKQQDGAAFHEISSGVVDYDHVNVNEAVLSHRRLGGVSLTAEYDASAVKITSISGYRAEHLDYLSDSDATPASIFRTRANPLTQNQFSQELRLTSNGNGPFNWIVGGYYFHEKSDLHIDTLRSGTTFIRNTTDQNSTNSYAAFAQADFKPLDALTLTAGLRYTNETKDFYLSDPILHYPPVGSPTSRTAKFKAWTPHFGINYQINPDVMVYASATRGFKSGGFNFATFQPAFAPETVWSYEAGLKSQLFDRKMRLNLTGFHYDYSNLQVRVLPAPGVVNILNAAAAKIDGVELETIIAPTDGLEFDFNLSYLDSRYTNYVQGTTDLSGKRLNRSPEWQGSGAIQYHADLGSDSAIELRANVQFQSRVFYTELNQDLLSGRPYALIGARASYITDKDRLRFSLFSENLSDTRYVTNALRIGTSVDATVNMPRTVALEVSYKF